MLRLAAEPNRWISVTAPLSASEIWRRASSQLSDGQLQDLVWQMIQCLGHGQAHGRAQTRVRFQRSSLPLPSGA